MDGWLTKGRTPFSFLPLIVCGSDKFFMENMFVNYETVMGSTLQPTLPPEKKVHEHLPYLILVASLGMKTILNFGFLIPFPLSL